uniref:Protein wntless-like protein n=1 Tax=Rhabditophanes sp. KR3021 TaxID=114890 RepID=A0AC35U8Y8_9BILA
MGAVIEELSNRKLFYILALFGIIQTSFFLFGALFSPEPTSFMNYLMTTCSDSNPDVPSWHQIRPNGCKKIDQLKGYTPLTENVRDIVFVAQMPHERDNIKIMYSPWFQFMLGMLDFTIAYNENHLLDPEIEIQLEVRMGYKSIEDTNGQWIEYHNLNITRTLKCSIDEHKKVNGEHYNCEPIDLFELSATIHPFYLLNIRFPRSDKACNLNALAPNCKLPLFEELTATEIHQNGGFTQIWLWLKCIVFPFMGYANYWYTQRINYLNRSKYLVEKAIQALGISMLILDIPIEILTFITKWPILLFIGDFRQGLFYVVLFVFWLIFAGEHLFENGAGNTLRNYWINLTLIGTASFGFLIYEMAERGLQLWNPFHSIWATKNGSWWAHVLLTISSIATILYLIFLTYKVVLVWATVKRKREAQLYSSNPARKLKVESIIFRFKFLMVFTIVCAFVTIATYFLKQIGEIILHEDHTDGETAYETSWTTGFLTFAFGMWNLYVLLLLAMYAPSHKYYGEASILMSDITHSMDNFNGGQNGALITLLKDSNE